MTMCAHFEYDTLQTSQAFEINNVPSSEPYRSCHSARSEYHIPDRRIYNDTGDKFPSLKANKTNPTAPEISRGACEQTRVSGEAPVTTGIAAARTSRSPGYTGSQTMRCVRADFLLLCLLPHGDPSSSPCHSSVFFFRLVASQFHIWPSVNDLVALTQPLQSGWWRACWRLSHADPVRAAK